MSDSLASSKSFLDKSDSIPEEFFRLSKAYPTLPFARFRTHEQYLWDEVNMGEAAIQVEKLAEELRSMGLGLGSRIGILSNSRVEWLIADLAILSIGGVSVSLYQSLLPKEIAFILHDSETEVLFAENQEQLSKLEQIDREEWEIPAIENREPKKVNTRIKNVITIEDTDESTLPVQTFNSIISKARPTFTLENKITRDSLASLVYTSGTTGPAKGVMQTHGNHLSNVRQVLDSGLMIPEASIYLFLPLAHSFARLMAYLASLTDLSVSFPEVADKKTSKLKPAIILRDMAEANSSIFPIVPRFLEKIRDQLLLQSEKKNLSGKLLKLTLNTAKDKYSGSSTFISHILYYLLSPMRKLITKKLFGSNFKYCVSGGAKLSVPVHEFFHQLGVNVYEGYGLTETVVATNAGRPGASKIGSVGKVLSSDIEILLGEDGEIKYRGPNISPGYLNRPEANASSWDKEGWFLTGDLGKIDEEGFLYVTGRKKEIIVTSGGKNIAPLPIEEKLMNSPLISQTVLIGDGRKFCSAIITINKEAVINTLGSKASEANLNDPSQCKIVEDVIWTHISEVNKSLASYEGIKKAHITSDEFSVENGLLTPSMKIKRKEVEKRYEKEIESFYSQHD